MTSLIRPGAKGIKVAAAALVLAVLVGGVASAGRPADAPTGDEKPQPGWEGMKRGGPEMPIERIVLTLVLILGGGAAAFWALRRFGPARRGAFGPGGSTDMKLVGRLPLGGRRGLVLVRAAGRLLVLGVSEAGIQKVLDRPDVDTGDDEAAFAGALAEASALEEGR